MSEIAYESYEKWLEAGAPADPGFGGGDGLSRETAFIVSEPVHLFKLAYDVAEGNSFAGIFFKLACNMNLNGCELEPIGYCRDPFDNRAFSGCFDGDGHAIGNFRILSDTRSSKGLFGYLDFAEINNLIVGEFSISVAGTVGGLAGQAESSSITGCSAIGTVVLDKRTDAFAGGLLGIAGDCTVTACSVAVKMVIVEGTGSGGLCGSSYNGTKFLDCSSTSVVHASSCGDVGGFGGSLRDTTVSQCSASGTVMGVNCSSVGGFVGRVRQCAISDCRTSGNVGALNEGSFGFVGGFAGYTSAAIERCVSAGNVTKVGEKGAIGGFAGDTVSNRMHACYSVGDVRGEGVVAGFVGLASSGEGGANLIEDCYCTGDVASRFGGSAAGFVGRIARGAGNIAISRCYSFGNVMGSLHGFVAENMYGAISNSFWRRDEGGINGDKPEEPKSPRHKVPAISTEKFADRSIFEEASWSFEGDDAVWSYIGALNPQRPHLGMLPLVPKTSLEER